MTAFPTAEEVAKQFLLYKLGETLKETSYETIAQQGQGGWPTEFLASEDVKFLNTLGVHWNNQPRRNGITILLGEVFVDMNDQDVGLERVEVDIPAYIGFVSLRT